MKSYVIRIAFATVACITGVLAVSTTAAPALTDPEFGPCVAPQRPLVVAGQETPVCFPPRLPGLD